MTVKRYDRYGGWLDECPDGEYVYAFDYDLLRAERDALAAENQQLRNALTVPSDFVRQPCIDGMLRVSVSQYSAALSGKGEV
jgi:hypothetical protein